MHGIGAITCKRKKVHEKSYKKIVFYKQAMLVEFLNLKAQEKGC